MQSRRFLLVCYLLLCCHSAYSQTTTDAELAPEDPYEAVPDVPYISDNLVGDPLSWSGPDSQGDCTYRPAGHGTWGGNAAHTVGTWFSNPAYRGCPQIAEDGTMRFSWRPEDNFGLTNTIDENSMDSKIAAYAAAFGDLGIMVNGYAYSWQIKSKDAENDDNTAAAGPYDKAGEGYSQDLLSIKVEFLGETNQDLLFEKTYDYNYRIENWTTFNGQEDFELDGKDISKIRMTIEGFDAGYWSGYYGPEIKDVQLQLLFTVTEVPIDCATDPGSSPTCYGYQDAFNQSIGLPTQAEMITDLEKEYGGYDGQDDGIPDDFTFDGTDDGIPDFDGQDDGGIIFDFELTESEKQEMDAEFEAQGGIIDDYSKMDGSFDDDGSIPMDGSLPEDSFSGDFVEDYSGIPLDNFSGNPEDVFDSEPDQFFEPLEEIDATGLPPVDEVFIEELPILDDNLPTDISNETQKAPSISINPIAIAKGAANAGNAVASEATSEALTSSAVSSESDITFSTNQSLTASINSNTIDANPGQTNAFGQIESNMGGGFDGSDSGYGAGAENIGSDSGYGAGAENIGSNGDIIIDNNAIDFSQQDFNSNFDNTNEYEVVGITVEIEIDAISSKLVNNAIKNIVNTLIEQGQIVPEEEQSPGLDNNAEDALVEAAISGDTSEDAQSALLGYNPNFRVYVTPQMPDNTFYLPKDIYPGQENYDNPAGRFFSGASDEKHKEMVRQQYERN